MKNTLNQLKEAEKIIYRCTKLSDEDRARAYAARTTKPSRIILGDDEKYWIVTPAEATKLEKLGYEQL